VCDEIGGTAIVTRHRGADGEGQGAPETDRGGGEEIAGTLPLHLQDLWVRLNVLAVEGAAEQKKLREAEGGDEENKARIRHNWLGTRVDVARKFFWMAVQEEFDIPEEALEVKAGWQIVFCGPYCANCGIHHEQPDIGELIGGFLVGRLPRM